MKRKMNLALVEDNRFHALLFEQAIAERFPDSMLSVFASAGAFAREFAPGRFDLVSLDYNLPDMNGLELLAIIRSQDIDIPVVVITGVGSEQTAVEAMKSGATDYIAKSGDYASAIPRVIKQAIHKQQLIRNNRRLEQKAQQAEKLKTIATINSTLNHEINNPLMTILGNIELLKDEEVVSADPGIGEKLKRIEVSARRIQAITRQIANLDAVPTTQTPVGPMLRLSRGTEDRTREKKPVVSFSADKSN